MFFSYLTLLVALILSGVAAFYSVVGLIAVFPGAVIPVIVMGSVLEVCKLLCASWLYRNWDIAPKAIKAYLLSAVFILALITSMGIFGFLSKAHLDSAANTVTIETQLKDIKDKLDDKTKTNGLLEKNIATLDSGISSLYNSGQASKGLKEFEKQKATREKIKTQQDSLQKEMLVLKQEHNKLTEVIRAEEIKVGPIRYVAEMIFGVSDHSSLERSVRYLILIIVSVFDPLAILLMVAANISLTRRPLPPEDIMPEDVAVISSRGWQTQKARVRKGTNEGRPIS